MIASAAAHERLVSELARVESMHPSRLSAVQAPVVVTQVVALGVPALVNE